MNEHLIKTIRFQERMLHELSNNSKKGDILEWKGISEKIVDLEYHKAKVLLAIRESNCFALREYIADCANILLSIGNEFGLYDSDAEALKIEAVLPEKIIQVRQVDKSVTKSFIPILKKPKRPGRNSILRAFTKQLQTLTLKVSGCTNIAKKTHDDKTPGSPEGPARYHTLQKAYRILQE